MAVESSHSRTVPWLKPWAGFEALPWLSVRRTRKASAPTLATVVIMLATGDRIAAQGADSGVLLTQAVAALRRAC